MAKPVTLRGGRERGASVASRDLTLPEWHARTPAIHAHANRSCTFRHSKHSRDVRLTEDPMRAVSGQGRVSLVCRTTSRRR